MPEKLRAGVIGATGMVGQRFLLLLENHPYFEVTALAASPASAGKPYAQTVEGRWKMTVPLPEKYKEMIVMDANDIQALKEKVDFVFCAIAMDKAATRALEESYAKAEIPVISNNSACRMVEDVPMVIPEINAAHLELIETQRKRLGTQKGFIAVKPNCSIQSYVPPISALLKYRPTKILACTYQAISGAGKTFETMPEILDNVIPYIGGEEEKSEKEPLKIWGQVKDGKVAIKEGIDISAQCYRVPVTDGHMAAVFVSFEDKPTKEEILRCWAEYESPIDGLDLPSAPKPFLIYMEEDNRPQPRLDRDEGRGMAVTMGRLREDNIFDYKFACLSHNTLRGAAGGGVLIAELLYKKGYLN